ncbi:7498_t:CDS:10 [Entrophospora sp. SA101]|nr:7495_t:CDS:10 [Entrophospora sp. SA101]CAJ0913298.1 7498_t:CDS:10 [Entrophospora sp. SA101]
MTSYSLLFSDNKICSERNKSIINFPNKHHLTFTYQINNNDVEKTYYFSHNIENHEFYIQEIINKDVIITESGKLDNGYELGFSFQVNQQIFYYAQSNQTKRWFIQELLVDGKLGKVTDRGQWLNVYQVIFPFQPSSSSIKAYYFGHNVDSNYWFIQELLEGGKLGLEVCNGHWEAPCHILIPFKIKDRDFFYSHNLDNCEWNIQELLFEDADNEVDDVSSKVVAKVVVIDNGRLKKPLRYCVSDPIKEIRIVGYRLLRYLITDTKSLEDIINLNYKIFIMRSLSKDPRSFNDEREEVLKLVRSFFDVPNGIKLIPLGILKSIVSIAEQSDDKLKIMSLETLIEIMIREPEIIIKCGGMGIILKSLIDGPIDMLECIIMSLLYILDIPETRDYIRPGIDLEINVIIEMFFDVLRINGTELSQRYLSRKKNPSLIDNVNYNDDDNDNDYQSFKDLSSLEFYSSSSNNSSTLQNQNKLNMIDHHLAILLVVLIDAGLLESLSKLFDLATRFDDEILRNAATEALSYIYYSNKFSKNSIIQIDDNQFRNMLIETQVLTTKDYTKWEVKPIMELLQKILLNPRRLEESIKINFIKSLLVFLSPNSRLFSDIVRSEENEKKYVDVGCTLLTTLLNNSYGVKYLEKKSFLRHISDCLNQLIPMNGISESEPLFSKDQINKTLTFGYFKIIGILCKCKEGLRLLEKFKILNTFYQLSELNGREDIIKSIINNLDYSMQRVRLYSTNYLGILLKKTEKNFTEWAVQLLITQLYDPMIEVCQMAIKILEELCDRNIDNIELMIKYRPYLDHLGEFGNNLLLKFLSTPIGFNYLYEINYLERELIDWFNLELKLSLKLDKNENNVKSLDGLTPPHFYGELIKTIEGCQMLRDKGHFTEFSNYIKNHGMEDTNYPIIKKLKSVLWAVGNIGSSKNGLTFLDEENIIKEIVHIAENSNVLSLRGTCYYVLGLISKTLKGVEILKDLGWESNYDPDLDLFTGLCLPIDYKKFLTVPKWEYKGADVILQENAMQKPIPSFETEKILLKTVSNLTNHILSNIESTTSLSK